MTSPGTRQGNHAAARPTIEAMQSPWMDVEKAAGYAGVSATTIRRAVASGELRAFRISAGRLLRLRVEDVDRWMMRAPAVTDAQGTLQG